MALQTSRARVPCSAPRKPSEGIRIQLALLEERRFANRFAHVRDASTRDWAATATLGDATLEARAHIELSIDLIGTHSTSP
jgi:hypothetical protein